MLSSSGLVSRALIPIYRRAFMPLRGNAPHPRPTVLKKARAKPAGAP
ncbi:hypothetical protein APY04_3231 [Hyphomicrobium sulfonivorans]|uniref:Uncharacterized protein n=1 Tax=Hyphomicrobium sulfonivorans TaxID=121290 RepID=A0A109B9A0_HYPSL|nr:hypothetical protein APY04_3231 [Hyphomicrobium sulfonivorans]